MGTETFTAFKSDGTAYKLKGRILRHLDNDPVTDADKSNIRTTLGITSQGGLGDLLAANNLDDVASKDTAKLNLEIPNVGTAANQVPLNGMLNSGAYLDFDAFYRTGSWTPTVEFGGASSGTYSIQEGGYQRTGSLVTVWGQVNNVSKSGNSGSVTVEGLPFTAAGSNVPYVGTAAYHNAASLSGQAISLIAGGTTSLMLFDSGVNGTSAVTEANYATNTITRFTITYQIA